MVKKGSRIDEIKKTSSNEDEITLDLSFIKNIFSSKKKSHHVEHSEHKSSDEDIKIDIKSIYPLLSKYSYIFLIFIAILISIHIRMLPAALPQADAWASDSVYNQIKNNIVAPQVNQQYPNLPQQNKDGLINQGVNQFYSQNSAQIQDAINQNANAIRERFRDEKGITYLGDIDSYYWLRYAENIIENGHIGDEIRDGKPYDNHMFAPIGLEAIQNMYPYIEAYLYKILKIFNPGISVMTAAFLTPMYLSFIAIIAAFFIAKKLAGNLAGFIASVLVAINPISLSRSLGSDNDIVNLVFPFIIMLFTFMAFDAGDKKKLLYTALSGLFLGIYSFAWSGWWFIFLFILAAAIGYLIYLLLWEILQRSKITDIINKKEIHSVFFLIAIFLTSTFIALTLVGNQSWFLRAFTNPFEFLKIKEASVGGISLWPNVYTTVAELNEADISQIVHSLGGITLNLGNSAKTIYFFPFALIGSILPLISLSQDKKVKKINLALVIFSVVFYYNLFSAATQGMSILRWLIFALLPIALIAYIYYFVTNSLIKKNNLQNILAALLIGFYYLFFISLSFRSLSNLHIFFMLSFPLSIAIVLSLFFEYTIDPRHSIIMVLWFMATMFAAVKGVRFILLIAPVFAISFGVFVEISGNWITQFVSRLFDVKPYITKSIIALIALALLLQPINIGYATAYSYIPSVDDGWVSTLTKIKAESKEDAIINSWWDFGHWFKYWADRAVTFDGASQNNAQAHFIGKVLLTDNERQAVSILRMLDCGANYAQSDLDFDIKDTHISVGLIYKFFEMKPEDVKKELLKYVGKEKADEILNKLFCEPPEDFFITSGDMVGKSGVWAHFGSWSFVRAKIYNYYQTKTYEEFISSLSNELKYKEEDAQKLYYELASLTTDRQINDWISPWPSYGGAGGCSKISNTTLGCNLQMPNGQIPLQINLTNMEASVSTSQGTFYPNSFGFFDGDEYKIKSYNENQLGFAAVLHPDNQNILLMADELVGSMFTRLYYLDGKGIKYFKKFDDQISIGGTRIITWKVDWEAFKNDTSR